MSNTSSVTTSSPPPMPDYKPSQVVLVVPPLVGTMRSAEVEHAAALLVYASIFHGDEWKPLTMREMGEAVGSLEKPENQTEFAKMVRSNPFFQPSFGKLVEMGFAEYSDDRKKLGFTAKGLEVMKGWAHYVAMDPAKEKLEGCTRCGETHPNHRNSPCPITGSQAHEWIELADSKKWGLRLFNLLEQDSWSVFCSFYPSRARRFRFVAELITHEAAEEKRKQYEIEKSKAGEVLFEAFHELQAAIEQYRSMFAVVQETGWKGIVERNAYKRAKEENDERFQRERDEARAECDRLRAELCAALGTK